MIHTVYVLYYFTRYITTALDTGWDAWSEWSHCSESCGGGTSTRIRMCLGGDASCDIYEFELDQAACNEWACVESQWGEWSPCEDNWQYRERCNEDHFECEFEEQGCSSSDTFAAEAEWSEWGPCNPNTLKREREMCSNEWGCEIEEENCEGMNDNDNEEEVDDGVWGNWSPCVGGLKSRHKCSKEGFCTEEEVSECFDSNWSHWGECSNGVQERSKCDRTYGCEHESRPCGAALLPGQWTEWGPCVKGFRSRRKCNAAGLDCHYEDQECYDKFAELETWSKWSKCKDGFQERELCKNHQCDMEVRICKAETSFWSGWSGCDKSGNQNRVRCIDDTKQCMMEERTCLFNGVVKLVQKGDGVYLGVDGERIEIGQEKTLTNHDDRPFEDVIWEDAEDFQWEETVVDDGRWWSDFGNNPSSDWAYSLL